MSQQNKLRNILPSQLTFIKVFYRNQMQYNYKWDENILKTLIQRNMLPTDPNKRIKFIIYYDKFKTANLVIKNNSSPSIGVLQKTNVIYQFTYPLGDYISENNNIYVGLTWYQFHSTSKKKNIHAQQPNFRIFLWKTPSG